MGSVSTRYFTTVFSECLSGYTAVRCRVPESDWQSARRSSRSTAARYGWSPSPGKVVSFDSPCRSQNRLSSSQLALKEPNCRSNCKRHGDRQKRFNPKAALPLRTDALRAKPVTVLGLMTTDLAG